jgi:1-acyl-sn-glycerol-3-phosphate acyltransferase
MEKLWLFKLTRSIIYAICRLYFRIEFKGLENVPQEGAMIVAPNHASYFDPFWVSLPIRRPLRYMTWDKVTQWPLAGRLLRAYGAFPISINRGSGDRAALRHSLEHLRAGGGLVIFPEGARTRTGRITPFKAGVIRLALDTEVPIVPVTVVGGYQAFPPHHSLPKPYKVTVIYHKPIKMELPANKLELKNYMRERADKLQSIVASALPPDSLPLGKESEVGS